MQDFDNSKIKSSGGELKGMIFENKFLKIPLQLTFSIDIHLEEIQLDDFKEKTSIVLDFINFKINSLEELEHSSLEFPINPLDGYIDGSMYLFNAHNPVDVTKIEFDKFVDNAIEVKVHYVIDFEYEGTPYKKTEITFLKTKLNLNKFRVDKEYLSLDDKIIDSKKLLEKFISTNNIGAPIEGTERQLFEMKVENESPELY